MRRTATRLLALAGLGAVAAGLAIVILGQGGGGDSGGSASQQRSAAAATGAKPGTSAPAPAREVTPGPDWGPYSGPVPILRYHAVGEASLETPAPELFVPPSDFGEQLGWLEEHGYEAVGLETVARAWAGEGTLPPKPIVLSFDGVTADLMSAVFPELRRRSWPAVLVLDKEAGAPAPGPVRKLLAAGWELEPQGAHPGAERRALEAKFGVPVGDFAFGQSESGEGGRPALEAAGYRGATIVGSGFAEASEPWAMPRITIFGLSGVEGFAEALRSRGEGVGA
jgi:hypothetical protein